MNDRKGSISWQAREWFVGPKDPEHSAAVVSERNSSDFKRLFAIVLSPD